MVTLSANNSNTLILVLKKLNQIYLEKNSWKGRKNFNKKKILKQKINEDANTIQKVKFLSKIFLPRFFLI
jgi:hypothetical protein